jgi:hypothetical protein
MNANFDNLAFSDLSISLVWSLSLHVVLLLLNFTIKRYLFVMHLSWRGSVKLILELRFH